MRSNFVQHRFITGMIQYSDDMHDMYCMYRFSVLMCRYHVVFVSFKCVFLGFVFVKQCMYLLGM